MSIFTRRFDYADRDAMVDLIAWLIEGKGQFAVCPFPQDLKDARRTGWVVSWPNETRAAAPRPEPLDDHAPPHSPEAA